MTVIHGGTNYGIQKETRNKISIEYLRLFITNVIVKKDIENQK